MKDDNVWLLQSKESNRGTMQNTKLNQVYKSKKQHLRTEIFYTKVMNEIESNKWNAVYSEEVPAPYAVIPSVSLPYCITSFLISK